MTSAALRADSQRDSGAGTPLSKETTARIQTTAGKQKSLNFFVFLMLVIKIMKKYREVSF